MDFVAIDFETANFKRESICSIGIAVVSNSEIVTSFSKLIKPTPNYFEKINSNIHKIKSEDVLNAPSFYEIWPEIKPYLQNKDIVAHNASFDFSALRAILNVNKLQYPSFTYYCSMLLAKRLMPGLMNYQLKSVCSKLNIEIINHHDAQMDAIACAKIILEISKIHECNSLLELTNYTQYLPGEFYQNDYFPFSSSGTNYTNNIQKTLFDTSNYSIDSDNPLFQKRIVFTGELSNMSRNNAQEIVDRIGGINSSGISKSTNYLVVGSFEFTKFGEGHMSTKILKANDYLKKGYDIQILSEDDFFKMIHLDEVEFEVNVEQIEEDSFWLCEKACFNEFSNRYIYFSPRLSNEEKRIFQIVGNCGGIGHDYLKDEIHLTDFFVLSDEIIDELKTGHKDKCIVEFESLKRKSQNRGNVKSIKIVSESSFYKYIKKRERHILGELKMDFR